MRAKQRTALWKAADEHGQSMRERKIPGGMILICGCGWTTTVRHQNALARNSKAHGAWMKHFKEAAAVGAKAHV